MESFEKKQSEYSQDQSSSLTHEERYLTASYAAMMAEMAKDDDYDFEDAEEFPSDQEEQEILFG